MQKKLVKKTTINSGFTLIELLIVVAIIAILAAIAVPNFLEAQVRSKISRARADMRTVTTALEIYYVDRNQYPYTINIETDDRDGYNNPRFEDMLTVPGQITSPVAYLTSLPQDVFKIGKNVSGTNSLSFGRPYASGNPRDITFMFLNMQQDKYWIDNGLASFYSTTTWGPQVEVWGLWQMRSIGPTSSYSNSGGVTVAYTSINTIYDATNGTVSFGHVIRTQKSPVGDQK